MQQNILVVLALLTQLNALPLNINLGAYSPALVVGDGEISFGGKQDVSNLMNALEGAAVSGAAAAAAAPLPPAAVTPATTAAQVAPASDIIPTNDQTTQITSLQGMGKEIAPRVVPLIKADSNEVYEKRDIAGFNAALNYATGALKTSPEVQLGTGEGGSGVGIIQKAGGAPAAAPAAAPAVAGGAAKARNVVELEKRDEVMGKKVRTTVTTMFVRGGPSQAQARGVVERSEEASAPTEKRTPSPPSSSAIDGVNLNMAEGAVAELTFVETRAVEDGE